MTSMADGDNKGGMNDYVKAESMVQIAIILPVSCLIGAGAGYLLDKHFGTSWMIVVGIALGAVAGFVSVFRTASNFLKRSGD